MELEDGGVLGVMPESYQESGLVQCVPGSFSSAAGNVTSAWFAAGRCLIDT